MSDWATGVRLGPYQRADPEVQPVVAAVGGITEPARQTGHLTLLEVSMPYLNPVRILSSVAAGTGAALGFLMVIAGLGLGFALLTSAQPPLQFATAMVLL